MVIYLIYILFSLNICLVDATVYHADPSQTDDTPFITASGKHINPNNPAHHRWIAVSCDLEHDYGFTFGTKVLVSGTNNYDGLWTVEDRMNSRWTKRIDFLINTDDPIGKWEGILITKVHPKGTKY